MKESGTGKQKHKVRDYTSDVRRFCNKLARFSINDKTAHLSTRFRFSHSLTSRDLTARGTIDVNRP